MNEYDEQAKKFLADINTTIEITKAPFQQAPELAKDGKHGIQYFVKLENPKGSFVFPFWDSIANKEKYNNSYAYGLYKKPNAYDVLACLGGYEPEQDYYEFCSEFGYTPSRESEKIHKAVLNEWENLNRIFTPEQLEQLSEIN